jgi:predicted RNA-binding protein YlxR (DUF448 family)
VVKADGGRIGVGRSLPGRGAWLCTGSMDCLGTAVTRKSFGRALGEAVTAEALVELVELLGRTWSAVPGAGNPAATPGPG